MVKRIAKQRGLMLVIALAMMAVLPVTVYARNGAAEEVRATEQFRTETVTDDSEDMFETDDGTTGESVKESVNERMRQAREKADDRVVAAKARLADAKLRRCEAHQKAITNVMARIGDRGQKQLDLFTTIADRVESFYVEKGYAAPNYEALVAEVNAKREAAQAVVTDITESETVFECDGDDPHGVIGGFKESLKLEIAALKEYRTAVKDLIVGVKSAAQSADPTDTSEEGVQE